MLEIEGRERKMNVLQPLRNQYSGGLLNRNEESKEL